MSCIPPPSGGNDGRLEKPVIYLYPEKSIDVSINLNLNKSAFTTVYPKFFSPNQWKVQANPNGDILIGNKK